MTPPGGRAERVVPSLTTTVADGVETVRSPPAGTVASEDPPDSLDMSTLTVSDLELTEVGKPGDRSTGSAGSGSRRVTAAASESASEAASGWPRDIEGGGGGANV